MPENSILKSIRILVVEDDKVMRRLLKDMLHIMGFPNVHISEDGQEGIDYLHFNPIDIVICDWKMHGMDGITFTRYVREQMSGGKRFLPIIMLTGKAEEKDVVAARDSGVTEYLIKPFTTDTLYSRIKSVVEQPRSFVLSDEFKGPDRRRKEDNPPDGDFKRDSD